MYRWRREATLQRAPNSNDDDELGGDAKIWSSTQKLALVLEASSIPTTELGAFLRRKGLHEAQLRAWREQALAGLDEERERRAGGDGRRIRELERELERKEKALAEAAALLFLRNKSWRSGGRGRRHGQEERAVIRLLVDEAVADGASFEKAFRAIGLGERTLQ